MKINTIDKLKLALNTCGIVNTESCYLEVLKTVDIPYEEWEHLFFFKENRPARVCITTTKDYQLVLSCWEKGQQGPIHDSDSEEVWIHPVCGQFREERYRLSKESNKLEQVSSVLMDSQSYSHMQKSRTIYKYINVYENRSVCLHLYSSPVTEWREYDNGNVNLVAHSYDKVLDNKDVK